MDVTQSLNFPDYAFSMRIEKGKKEIFDPARRKFVALTPEEWVRQHMLQYLVQELSLPLPLIAVEHSLVYLSMKKRCDLLVFNRAGKAVMMVECKAPSVLLNQKTLEQIARYNMGFKLPYLLITNGLSHYCCHINHADGSIQILPSIPVLEL